ncbi:SDR family oxidoreductase [Roseospira marina]|uniref:SDR family oxidoreductase n=1 Tax=Roseospira marina TaxID=140057 RepID=A0A5M6IAH7_9PROT|nr:SDR family NAD(P)-dependent oxidoreductase [Roseospira marina]KAA5605203.1 SDR family oxidoreductase [Roseospira marina]MBB4314657.1 3-oxoacyl-[acyl-carrier protein] reductase [Roseospira marina]MBB5087646.1 3-oxoacyl-[acyl-carrier protein] reductase [Roseospira marina]
MTQTHGERPHPAAAPLLDGKVAVVTGANRGIGRAIADVFRAHGAHVLACARAAEPVPARAADDPEHAAPGGETPIPLDLADAASIKAAIKAIRAAAPRVDILVNNAGVASGGLFQMTTLAEMRAVFEVNVFGPLALTQGVARLMARTGAGSIINLSSVAADRPDPGTLAYGASKAALARATRSLATELGGQGIRVNAIAPGVTETAMQDEMDPAARDALIGASALNTAATPQDIANVALFLASDLSSHITGQTLRVDGGIV